MILFIIGTVKPLYLIPEPNEGMIERTEKRTVEDLHRIVSHLESTYSDFHSKATSVLQSLKSTSKSLGVPSSSSHKYDSDILMWCVELYQQVWLCSTSKILKL